MTSIFKEIAWIYQEQKQNHWVICVLPATLRDFLKKCENRHREERKRRGDPEKALSMINEPFCCRKSNISPETLP